PARCVKSRSRRPIGRSAPNAAPIWICTIGWPANMFRPAPRSTKKTRRAATTGMKAMQKRKLGRSDIEIAPLMIGGNVFGWTADRKATFALLDAFVEAGINAIDTADVYSIFIPGNKGGESESLIGEWFKHS